jgi:release factor glutamine methyltransferase
MSCMSRISELLQTAHARRVDKLDAHLLMALCTGRSRTWLIAHDDSLLPADQQAQFVGLVARRSAGEPLAYLLGEKEFHGLNLKVNAHVLVPRPDTEVLVAWALEVLRSEFSAHAAPRVIDLGCGSGAIALAVKNAWPQADVTAVDASPEALAVAQSNAEALGLDVRFVLSDWWLGVGLERFDLAVSNPPYIAALDPHLAALSHEPKMALTSGPDGLDALRVIISGAGTHLRENSWLILEHGHDQSAKVQTLLTQSGFKQAQSRPDLAGHLRCTGGRI